MQQSQKTYIFATYTEFQFTTPLPIMSDILFQQCRNDFEAHFSLMDLTRHGGPNNPNGVYIAPATFSAFMGWQAAYLKLKAKAQ